MATSIPTFCPVCGDTAEWCRDFADEVRKMEAARDAAIVAAKAKPVRKPRKRVSKAQAMVDFGIADSIAEARAMMRDMGEAA